MHGERRRLGQGARRQGQLGDGTAGQRDGGGQAAGGSCKQLLDSCNSCLIAGRHLAAKSQRRRKQAKQARLGPATSRARGGVRLGLTRPGRLGLGDLTGHGPRRRRLTTAVGRTAVGAGAVSGTAGVGAGRCRAGANAKLTAGGSGRRQMTAANVTASSTASACKRQDSQLQRRRCMHGAGEKQARLVRPWAPGLVSLTSRRKAPWPGPDPGLTTPDACGNALASGNGNAAIRQCSINQTALQQQSIQSIANGNQMQSEEQTKGKAKQALASKDKGQLVWLLAKGKLYGTKAVARQGCKAS